MSTPTVPPAARAPTCALGLTRAQVAAWHDGALASDEARRLDAHVAGCPACAAHLVGFEQSERTVRAERVPEPDERLWRMVRTRHRARVAGTPSRRMLGGLGALAAVLLLAIGFSQLFRTLGARPSGSPTTTASVAPSPSPSPSPTDTPAPITMGPQLAWRPITPPPGFTRLSLADGFAPSAVDGKTAFACFTPQGATALQLWATHDAAHTWTRLALPAGVTDGSCEVVPDANRLEVLALGVGPVGAPPNVNQFYITDDDAATWHALPHGTMVFALATYRAHGMSATYAVLDLPPGDGASTPRLDVSRDAYATWRSVDFGAPADEGPLALWMQPESGELLVETNSNGTYTLYASLDGRATWKVVTTVTQQTLVIGQPTPGMPYHVCSIATPEAPTAPPVACNLNILLGGTFPAQLTTRPPLRLPGDAQATGVLLKALATDGTLLALRGTTSATGTTYMTTYALCRLAPGAAGWQSIGPAPEFHLLDTATATDGDLLWALPEYGVQLDPQGRIFVAQLP